MPKRNPDTSLFREKGDTSSSQALIDQLAQAVVLLAKGNQSGAKSVLAAEPLCARLS